MNPFLVGALIVVAYEFGMWRAGRKRKRPGVHVTDEELANDPEFIDRLADEMQESFSRRNKVSPLPNGENGVELKVWDVPGAEEANLN